MSTPETALKFHTTDVLRCKGHQNNVTKVEFSNNTPDGTFMISASHDERAMLRDGNTGEWVGSLMGHKGAVRAADMNANATFAVTGGADYTLRYWNAVTGAELLQLGQSSVVKTVRVSRHEDRKVLAGGNDRRLRIYDVAAPEAQVLTCERQPESMTFNNATFGKDDSLVFSGSQNDKNLRCWDIRTLRCELAVPLPGTVRDLEVSRDEALLTVATETHVLFFDITKGLLKKYDHDLAAYGEFSSASLHPQHGGEKAVFAAGERKNGAVCFFDMHTGDLVGDFQNHSKGINSVRFNPNGNQVASASDDHLIYLFRMNFPQA